MKDYIKKIWNFIQKHLNILKAIFVMAVLVYVIIELGRIVRDLNGQEVRNCLSTQDPLTLIVLFIFGFVAVLPMLNYDYEITKFLPGEYSLLYILKSGWTVNTFTNILGFGGFLGASLRAHFYGKKASQKQILFAISKIALFLLSGLSIWCLISLTLIFIFHIGIAYAHYWIWLLGGGLYFPILMLLTHLKDSNFFSDLTTSIQVQLTLGSVLEWGFAAGFFILIGYLMKLSINFIDILPLFMVANVIGEISMMPGGIGSFDLIMITELNAIGLNNSIAVVWLIFYRIFYYIFPFLLGTVFIVHDTSGRLNNALEGLPKKTLKKIAHIFIILFLYFSVTMLLLIATVPNIALGNHLFLKFYPYTFIFLDRTTNILVAFLLLGFARGIANKVKKAFWPTIVLLIIAMSSTLYRNWSIHFIIFFIIVLISMFLIKSDLIRERLQLSWNDILIDSTFFVFSFIFYAIAYFYNTPYIYHHHVVPLQFLFPSEQLLIESFFSVILAAITLYIILCYLSSGNSLKGGFDSDRIQKIINKYGGNEVSHLAYLRDKSVYYYQENGEDQVFFLYRQKANKIIIMGEPVGNKEKIILAIQSFMQYADKQDFSLVFYEISSKLTMQLHELGFDFIKIGEDGLVELSQFNMHGNHRKAERAIMNKLNREGYKFDILNPPFSDHFISDLKKVSDNWLNGKNEKGFSLGFFDKYYLEKAPIAVVYNKDNKIVAFATIMPYGEKNIISIDLMRHLLDAPTGIMDDIFINLFEIFQQKGYKYFDMGMAPLSNVGTSTYSFIEEKIVHIIYEYGYRFYGFQGLRSYKDKYVTKWESKYISFRKRSSIIFTMLQILLVVNQKINLDNNKNNFFSKHFLHSVQIDSLYERNKEDKEE